jgi:hypothetical protein
VVPVLFMITLAIALVAGPAGALNQLPARPGSSGVLNDPELPPPVPIQIPEMINYQGYLTDSDGNPINGTLEMTFSIYDTAEGGSPVWTETHPSVTVTDGLFNVLLGSVNVVNATHLTGRNSYLAIKVGTDPEMTPRQQIVSVAYAHRCHIADTLDAWDSTAFVMVAGDTMTGQLVLPADGLLAGTDQLVLTGGKVCIGTTSTEDYKLYVQGGGNNGILATGKYIGVGGVHSNSGNFGYLGTTGEGVYGSSTNNRGVSGYTINGIGVVGTHSDSGNYGRLGTSNEGVYGEHDASGNYGRLGTGNDGVAGTSNTDIGSGVFGLNTATGHGVYGRNSVSGNYGYLGSSDYGIYGHNNDSGNYGQLGTETRGVYGYSSTYNGHGVYGEGYTGVYGDGGEYGVYGDGGYAGVYGEHSTSGNYGQLGTADEGVYGKHSSGNYGYIGGAYNGVYGKGSDYGVYGNGGDCGVYGISNTYGVYGISSNGTGVYGIGSTWDFYAYNDNYGPFTGGHEVKLADSFPADIQPGLIVSTTGESQLRTEEGEISYSSTLPTVQLSDTPNDKTVFGVLIKEAPLPEDHWYQANEGERFGIVNALGDGRVWVTNINGDIENGDYITTSAIAGYGQKQDDDLLHSYTLGKAIETVDWSQVTDTIEFNGQVYKIYTIAVVYTSG